ncbi:MAG: small multi-drug export protein [Oscillospiraceae bacterium]|nr:small multi-drug export protein [Clostridiales bacterium]MDY5594629.1 small multi-drug export protein [Oscillospiraceae bacterium]
MKIWDSLIGKIIMTFLISMVPVVELRGAIPIGVAHGLNFWVAIAVSIVGNLVPVPFIIIFIRKIFAWLRTKSAWLNDLVTRLENRALKKTDTVRKFKFWGLFIFVAIPLPGTGAWTGALVAAMLEMRVKDAFPAIALGVLTAGIIVAFVTYGAGTLLFGL